MGVDSPFFLELEVARLEALFVDLVVLFVDFFFSEAFFLSGVFLAGLLAPRVVADGVATLVFVL